MRSILLDELNTREMESVREYLAARARPAGLQGLYWLYLVEGRIEAEAGSGPAAGRVAVETGDSWIKFELFKRTGDLYNNGGGFLTARETAEILEWVRRMVQELHLRVC